MNLVKVSSSGQITLPKAFRAKFDTKIYSYQIKDNEFVVVPVKIDLMSEDKQGKNKAKYTLKDLEKVIFTSKNKNEKNIADKIDNILYN